MTEDSGEGSGGSDPVEARIDGGVDHGLGGGEAFKRRFVRKDAKKATPPVKLEKITLLSHATT